MRSNLVALGLGMLVALTLGELVVRFAAHRNPWVAYLATASARSSRRRFSSLEEYLASRAAVVVSHRNWFNYWTNALGMNDEEFLVPKPAGRFRIMAVGDSFTYGLVPYPDAVMTVVKSLLHRDCRGKDLDLLNFGVAGAVVSEYRTLVTLGLPTYDPDLVVVHFFTGKDGPDGFRQSRYRPRLSELPSYSYLWTLATRIVTLERGVDRHMRGVWPEGATTSVPRGGTIVDPTVHIREDDPALVGPYFTEDAFTAVQAGALRQLYVPPQAERLDEAWSLVYADLDAMREPVAARGRRIALVVYPSELQVDPRKRDALIATLRQQPPYATLSSDDIDPQLPNRRLASYCQSRGLPCFDVTPAIVAARQSSDEPLYKTRDTHWTIRGNRVAAEAEAAYLTGLVCPSAENGEGTHR